MTSWANLGRMAANSAIDEFFLAEVVFVPSVPDTEIQMDVGIGPGAFGTSGAPDRPMKVGFGREERLSFHPRRLGDAEVFKDRRREIEELNVGGDPSPGMVRVREADQERDTASGPP